MSSRHLQLCYSHASIAHATGLGIVLLLLGLIPLVGGIVLLVFYIQEGTAGANQYGPGTEPAA